MCSLMFASPPNRVRSAPSRSIAIQRRTVAIRVCTDGANGDAVSSRVMRSFMTDQVRGASSGAFDVENTR